MFEGPFAPPFYLPLYNFPDGAQDDIFADALLPIFDENGKQSGSQIAGVGGPTSVNIVTPTVSSWPTETPVVGFAKPTATTSGSSSASGSYYGKWYAFAPI